MVKERSLSVEKLAITIDGDALVHLRTKTNAMYSLAIETTPNSVKNVISLTEVLQLKAVKINPVLINLI